MSDEALTTPSLIHDSAETQAALLESRTWLAPVATPATGLEILGVHITDATVAEAIELMDALIHADAQQPRVVNFANAHTLNCAYEDASYRAVLNRSNYVFGDGTGVRWAARLQGVRLKANLNGTDLLPAFMTATADRGYSYYMLGTTPDTLVRAVERAKERFAGWKLVGCHHGYLNEQSTAGVLAEIRQARPDMLLVAMGNPYQEQWIDRYRAQLGARLCLGVGGLFNFWSGDVARAPGWLRWLGHEWLNVIIRQPHKWRRYILGNPKYLARIAAERCSMGR